jgi:PAS domain S-box-containing protein
VLLRTGRLPDSEYSFVQRVGQIKLPKWAISKYRNHMSGYTHEDFEAGPLRWDKLTPEEWMPVSLRTAKQLAETGMAPPYEKEYRRKDGSRWWGLFAPRMLNEKEAVEFIVEITERKQAEKERERLLGELERSNEELTLFAHVAAHDLQTPLRAVTSYTQLLQRRLDEQLDETSREFMALVIDGVRRMEQLIKALLRYAQVGQDEPKWTCVPMQALVKEALEDLAPPIQDNAARVDCAVLPNVHGDKVQLLQLLQNLLANAIKYRRPEVPPHIQISAQKQCSEWIFTVADNGQGIPPEDQQKVFLPLKRLHGLEVPGTGIGLAVCRRIVERHRGRIWVQSEPGVGSKFRFIVPDHRSAMALPPFE